MMQKMMKKVKRSPRATCAAWAAGGRAAASAAALTQFRYDPLGFTAHGMYNINQMPRKSIVNNFGGILLWLRFVCAAWAPREAPFYRVFVVTLLRS